MTIRATADGVIMLEGDCLLEEVDALQRELLANPEAVVDWTECTAAHTAVIQVLLAARPVLRGPPVGAFLRDFIAPVLRRNHPGSNRDDRQD
jgi:hypothetical protein